MIKLSDVKVRPRYRTRVRYRLDAWEHGPAAAGRHYGLSARRWRKRWRRGGVEGLVPSYPRHRARRVSPAAVELIRHARQEFGYGAARTRLWLQRVHGAVKLLGILSALPSRRNSISFMAQRTRPPTFRHRATGIGGRTDGLLREHRRGFPIWTMFSSVPSC
jgi:hypothetical protein